MTVADAAGVSVWLTAAEGKPWETSLAVGQSLTFGRGAPGQPVHLALTDPAVSRLAGEIRAVEDYWSISNYSTLTTYVVQNAEGGGEFLKVPPRRLYLPVPFEFSRVLVVPGHPTVGFNVTASQHLYAVDDQRLVAGADPTTSTFSLDRTARYFLVLVALCEPLLRDPSSTAMPTAKEVVARLRSLPSCRDLTVEAVHGHIRYLATTKLRVRLDGGAGRQREQLVAIALRFDLVREDDLKLLPSVPPAGRPPAQHP